MPESSTREPSLYDPDARISGMITKNGATRAQRTNTEQGQTTKAQQDGDWLLRNYEEQLRAHNTDSSKDGTTNLYYQIRTDKNLSRLAGLTAFDPTSSEQIMDLHVVDPGKNGLTLRPDPNSQIDPQAASKVSPLGTQPLSWASSNFASLQNNFAAPTAGSMQQFAPQGDSSSSTPAAEYPSYTRQNFNPTALDTPGMTAAQSDPVMDRSASPLTLDLLPNESPSSFKTRQENLTLLDPPKASNMAQLEKLELSAMKAPGQFKTAPPVPLNPALLKAQYDPPPVTAPPTSPIRTPIDDPRDMTFR